MEERPNQRNQRNESIRHERGLYEGHEFNFLPLSANIPEGFVSELIILRAIHPVDRPDEEKKERAEKGRGRPERKSWKSHIVFALEIYILHY